MRLAALALVLLATPALAQDRPPAIFPTRDVAVTYRTSTGETVRMAWLAGERKMRMDMGPQGWMVVEQGEARAFMVMEQQRMVMQMAGGGALEAMREPGAAARFTREGADRVAGTPCTIWRIEENNHSARVCMTQDGVMLRTLGAGGNREAQIEATAVAYGAQDPARFRIPQGYQVMQMPQGMPQGLPGMPGGTQAPRR